VSTHVELPFWVAAVLLAFAAWALIEHFVLPGLRWMVTHPANQVIDKLSDRLRIGIRPFQRTRRQALIHRLLTDPKVQQTAEQFALKNNLSRNAVLKRIDTYAREIVPAFNAYLYFRTGYWIGRLISRALYRVRIGYIDSAGIAAIDSDATVVLVMNHRSNMDYILAGYLAADQAALSYAVGEWARLWPLSALIRAMGAYFVRRNSGDELYRRVLERYIAMAPEAGVSACSTTCCAAFVSRATATWFSCRSVSTTTACSKTVPCSPRWRAARPGACAPSRVRSASSCTTFFSSCAASGVASATPASTSALRSQCAPTAANTASISRSSPATRAGQQWPPWARNSCRRWAE
jgi:hypothetical protein